MIEPIGRRAFLSGCAATGALAILETPAAARGKRFFERTGVPIGLQLYTLGDEVGKDLDATLAAVVKIGCRDLELPSTYGKTPAELKAAADRAGVSFSAIHLAAMPNMPKAALSMMSEPQRIIDDLGALGIKSAVLPIMLMPSTFKRGEGETFQSAIAKALVAAGEDIWKRTADLLNEKGAALKPHGIRVGYHNHNMEFAPIGETTGWEVLAKATDPGLVGFEVDVGWVAAAGLDPVAFLAKHRGRVTHLHVKDIKASTKPNFALTMDPTEVGAGRQNWAKILPAAHKAGVRHFYIEQEAPFTIPRMDAVRKSHDYLSALVA